MTLSNCSWLILPLSCLVLLTTPLPATAIVAAHSNFNCGCHSLHNSVGASLLIALNTELTCLGCHGPLGTATEVTIHNPLDLAPGDQGYITCRECHDAHNNFGSNVKLVGYNWDPEIDPDNTTTFSVPTIRVELSTTNPADPSVYRQVTFTDNTDFNIDNTVGGRGVCEICHTPFHNQNNDCTACHQHANGFEPTGCTSCHSGNESAIGPVGPDSPHSETNTGYSCADCHNGHGAGTIEIPNNTDVGINYVANGESGISLGSSTVTGGNEAEICWNCHDNEGVSEWGSNTHTATGSSPYDYGSLDQSNWITAIWSSANFSYKTGAIQSTHSVDGLASEPGLDPVDSIRCSYCHDVHELALAPNDTKADKPYLRGTWKGNPYLEDGAPETSSTYTPQHWGAVPRGSTLNNEYGGYQIDQNNGYPTSAGAAPTWNSATSTWNWPAGTWSLNTSAGLCVLCHGVNIDAMNTFGLSTEAWIGVNGHSNAVIGGTGSAAANIFRTSLRAPSGVDIKGAKPDMGYRNHGTGVGYGFRGTDGRAFEILNPTMDGQLAATASRPYGGNQYQWGAQVNDATTEKKYHQFSCSKCHNPHASRLPRLMITNCLDTKQSTWDDPRTGINAVDQAKINANSITLSATSTPDNWGRTWSNTTSAQNCHRLAGDNRATPKPGFGTGWNKVTPW